MTNKEKFLSMNVGFHFEDLSLSRQLELSAIQEEMKVSKEWIMLALSKKDLNNWEEWGFALFKNSDFKTQISLMEKQLNKMDDSKFKNEIKKKKTKEKSLWVSDETFNKIYDGIKAQGKLYADSENGRYYTYGYALTAQGKQWIDEFINKLPAKEYFDEDLKLQFCLAVYK